MNGKIVFRIVSALVMIAAIAGIAQGSPITIEAPEGQVAPAPYPHFGYGYGMPFHRPFGFGDLAAC